MEDQHVGDIVELIREWTAQREPTLALLLLTQFMMPNKETVPPLDDTEKWCFDENNLNVSALKAYL